MNLKQRLLDIISPVEYDIVLKPDLQNFTFTGEETLTCIVLQDTKEIILHAVELKILQVQLDDMQAEISYNEKLMQVILHFPKIIKKGEQKLQLTFSGKIGEQLKGWYKSRYSVNGEIKHMVTTQFEEIGAREVFPSIDDPSAKAVFNISFMIPSHLTAISNTIDTTVIEHENGFKTVAFAPTPKMATYALAMIVGEFDFVEGTTKSGIQVRVFTTPGKKSQAQFALDTALNMLPFYETYFDIPYPLLNLDLIAIPDFDAGAMENWGAITFREAALLVDDKETSAANKQWVAIVIAHELTHMWFGNLVTMKWWEDLWLNEGFASYMEYVGVNHIFPQWNMWEQFAVLDHNRAMGLDSLEHTHPIQSKISSVEKVAENFDEVSYSKGASIIQMIADYIGEEMFQEGLRFYLKKYAYSNAETNDLWNALEKVSGKKIKQIMESFTKKPGHPIISVTSKNNILQLIQSRFYSSPLSLKKSKDTTIWPIPLINKTAEKEEKILFDRKKMDIPFADRWIKINAQETSFARTIYSQQLYETLQNPIQKKLLSSIDRMGIMRDAFDSAESGFLSTVDGLKLAKSYTNETSYIVWAALCGKLGKVENLLSSDFSETYFYPYARNILGIIGKQIGWEKKPTDSHSDILLRGIILATLGEYKDKEVIKKANELFEKVVKNKSSVDTDIRGVVYALIAENGGQKEFEILKNLYIQEEMSAEKNRIGNALCLFPHPELVEKAMEFAVSEHVRTQDIGRFLAVGFGNKKGREVVWEFIKNHWDELLRKMAGLEMDWIVDGAAVVADKKLSDDIFAFFKTHQHPKLEKAMKQVVEQIESNLDWKNRDRESIEKFLQKEV